MGRSKYRDESRSKSYSRSSSYSRSPTPRRSRSRDRGRKYRSPPRRYKDSPRGGYNRYKSRDRSRSRGGYRGPYENQEVQVYVARFARKTREEDLERAFEKYGQIEKIDLKEGRGFGFIYFRSKRDAEDAIDGMNGRTLPQCDERLVVERAGLKRRDRRNPRFGGSGRRRSRSRGFDREKSGNCYNCGKDGHFARECREKRTYRDDDTKRKIEEGRCFVCDEKGHKKMDCPQRGKGGGGRFNRDNHDRRGSKSPFDRSGSRKRSHSSSRSPRGRKDRFESKSSKHSKDNDDRKRQSSNNRKSNSRGSAGYARKTKQRSRNSSRGAWGGRRSKSPKMDFDETEAQTINMNNGAGAKVDTAQSNAHARTVEEQK